MLSFGSYGGIEESVGMVQTFRGMLEKELRELTGNEPCGELPTNVRNRVMIKLIHLRNSTRKLKQELNGMRQYIGKVK